MEDPFNLDRFVVAQEKIYANVVEELKAGIKISHWMCLPADCRSGYNRDCQEVRNQIA
jgi:uncharacterized protein (DUF1810 family)